MEDSNSTLWIIIIGSLIGIGLWAWALYEIIGAASKGKKILEEQEMQTLLLVEIAKKLGVEENAIDEIIYEPEPDEPEPDEPEPGV
jgi:hypothetical protein